jgi:hypothetical protein
MTDNEGESAYSYRNFVRAMGAMGMDFIFATDHASDGTQIDGGLALLRKNGDPLGEPCDTKPGDAGEAFRIDLNNLDGKNASCRRVLYKEARDLNKKRFLYAKRILYGTGTANQGVAEDIENRGMANYLSRGLLPKIFMGEEVDAWPEMSLREQKIGYISYGDGLEYQWVNAGNCIAEAEYSLCENKNTPGRNLCSDKKKKRAFDKCRSKFSKDLGTTYGVLDEQGLPKLPKQPHKARQHLVYMPYSFRCWPSLWRNGR